MDVRLNWCVLRSVTHFVEEAIVICDVEILAQFAQWIKDLSEQRFKAYLFLNALPLTNSSNNHPLHVLLHVDPLYFHIKLVFVDF